MSLPEGKSQAMSKLFYDHLIVIEEVIIVFEEHELSKEDQKELLHLIDETLEHEILNLILTHLPKELHEPFFAKLARAPHDPNILTYLQDHMPINVTEAILIQANTVKRGVIKQIKASKTPPRSH